MEYMLRSEETPSRIEDAKASLLLCCMAKDPKQPRRTEMIQRVPIVRRKLPICRVIGHRLHITCIHMLEEHIYLGQNWEFQSHKRE